MSPEVHRAALRAAAKLALSAAFVGCGSPDTSSGNDGPSASDYPSSTESNSDAVRAKKKKKDAGAASECGAQAMTEASCRAEVAKATFPKTASPDGLGKPDKRVDATTRECCDLIAKAIDKGADDKWKERDACCSAIGWRGSATCTPWGPPVPPAMRRVA